VVFGAVVLITGSIWAKAAWGHWWTFDPRLTMSLILWMTMLGYVLVRKYGGMSADRLSAGLAAFAGVNVPLVYFVVNIVKGGDHPSNSAVPTLTGEMRVALWTGVLLYFCVFLVLLMYRVSAARARRSLYELRERALDAGLLE
jgi:heme exporter protein C